ncbi:MAG: DsbA family protein [Chloroflexota bacterium]
MKKKTAPIVEIEEVEADETMNEEEDVIKFKRSHFYSVLVVVAFLAGVLVGYFVWGVNGGSGAVAANPQAAPTAPPFRRYDIPTDGFHSIGPADAPITIVEFSDFQCPYCQRWREQVFDPLLAAYPGKIRIVYRNLPLTSIHPQAMPAAEAAMCAGEQNVFWEYHDKLFENQSGLGNDLYLQLATDLGLKMETFEACIADHKYQEAIKADMDFALGLGVQSTPTFFINGIAIVGAQPLTSFTQVIDKELAGGFPD